MFDVGFWELFVIGLIALIVFGPERLPGLARTVGLWIGRARAAFYSVREEVEREINADGLRETRRALQREMEEGTRSVTKAAQTTDAATEQQTRFPQSPAEDEEKFPPTDESSSLNPKDGSNADRGEAGDRITGRNTRQ